MRDKVTRPPRDWMRIAIAGAAIGAALIGSLGYMLL